MDWLALLLSPLLQGTSHALEDLIPVLLCSKLLLECLHLILQLKYRLLHLFFHFASGSRLPSLLAYWAPLWLAQLRELGQSVVDSMAADLGSGKLSYWERFLLPHSLWSQLLMPHLPRSHLRGRFPIPLLLLRGRRAAIPLVAFAKVGRLPLLPHAHLPGRPLRWPLLLCLCAKVAHGPQQLAIRPWNGARMLWHSWCPCGPSSAALSTRALHVHATMNGNIF